jgi:hypothetical protein
VVNHVVSVSLTVLLLVCEGVCVFKSSIGLTDQISQNHLGYRSTKVKTRRNLKGM